MPKTIEEQVAEVTVAVAGIAEKVGNMGTEYTKELAKNGSANKELTDKLDQNMTALNGYKANLAELEQKIAAMRDGNFQANRPKSAGAQFAESEAWKTFAEKGRGGSDRFLVKNTITSVTTDTDGAAGDLVSADRQAGVQLFPQRQMTIRNLLTPGQTASNLVEYVQQTGFTNAAAMVSEGAAKQESTMKFNLIQAPVRTMAHWVQASRQILADAPQLRSIIDGQLRYGLQYVEEVQLLKGDGTGQNLTGLMQVATAYSAPFAVAGETAIDRLRLAMLQAALAEWPATGHVLNPIDWTRIELTKDDLGRYIIGNPQGTTAPRLWGLPVVATQAQDEGDFLTGAFRPAAQIFDREGTEIFASTEDRDNFIKNLVTILAEQRLALAIYRPEALIKGNFDDLTS